jgi:hypothetical protein
MVVLGGGGGRNYPQNGLQDRHFSTRCVPLRVCLPRCKRDIFLSSKNQRQHRTLHIQKDVLPTIRSPPPTVPRCNSPLQCIPPPYTLTPNPQPQERPGTWSAPFSYPPSLRAVAPSNHPASGGSLLSVFGMHFGGPGASVTSKP